jgi:hypothetical protein
MMSSAFAMVLVAAMAVPGIGPEKVSGEMDQGLDLRGEWEALWWNDEGIISWFCFDALCFDVVDEGRGKLRATMWQGRQLGIYQRQGDQLNICLRDAEDGRPTSFKGGDGQDLFILHRVKPRKRSPGRLL